MGNKDQPTPSVFNWRRASRSAILQGTGAAALTTCSALAVATIVGAPIVIPAIAASAAIFGTGAASLAVVGEYVNHKYDDPVFDRNTTILFDLVGLTFGFLLFVIPAMQLEATLSPGAAIPGALALLSMCLTSFGVVILRGLLMNFGIVRDEDRRRDWVNSP